jgi:hypothetical protein
MLRKIKTQLSEREQASAFRKAARELGADQSDERFKDALRNIAKAKPIEKRKDRRTSR